MKLRPGRCISKISSQAWSRYSVKKPRKNYIKALPRTSLLIFQMGVNKDDYDLELGLHRARGPQASAQFEDEPLEEVGRPQEGPESGLLREEAGVGLKALDDEPDGGGIAGAPAGFQASEGLARGLRAVRPEDGVEIGLKGLPVGGSDPALDPADVVDEAELVGDAEALGDGGLDALLSTVQMPSGVPVATMAIGKPGARNAAVLAAQILALNDASLAARLRALRREAREGVAAKDRAIRKEAAGRK
jgi:hypothetical protein